MIEIKLSWDPDHDRALENTRFWAPLSLTAEQKHSITSPAEMERAADELPIEQVARRWIVASDPEEVVRYRPGEDDVRRIDWNVTARSGEAHVWRPLAEHELEAWVLVDDTPSMAFGTVALEKRDVAAGVVAAVSLLTQGPGNRLGTAHLTVLEQWLGNAGHHLTRLAARVTEHEMVDAV